MLDVAQRERAADPSYLNQHSQPSDHQAGATAFIRANMHVVTVTSVPEIVLYAAHPASGLGRLSRDDDMDPPPPYWAYQWAGGLALARHVLDHPETVAGLRVLDLGAGSGLVGIAAARAGAASVLAAEIDPNGIAAIGLNAALNGVSVIPLASDLTVGPPPGVDLVLVGDLFYAAELASVVTAFLDRCLSAGIAVLVGDPGRAHLPHVRLRHIADHTVADVGTGKAATARPSAVFSFLPPT